jgi:hypothetical protein
MKGRKGTELLLITDNKVGRLSEISQAVKDNEVDIQGISAWVFDQRAFFRLVVSNQPKTRKILESFGKVEEKEVVIVEMPDEVGQLFDLASKLKDNNIDISYIYGTTSEPGKAAIVIFSSDNNDKVLEVIAA